MLYTLQAIAVLTLVPVFGTVNGSFIVSPKNTTAYIGREARFTCAISLDFHSQILWYAYVMKRYVLSALLPPEYGASTRTYQEGDHQLTSILTVEASFETNGTLIVCKGDSPTNQPIYHSAVLSVQGLLAAPYDVTYTLGEHALLLKWKPPFSLPRSNMDFIVNASTARFSNSLVTSHPNQTFSYSSLNISHCNSDYLIEFTIRGMNPSGVGLPAAITVLVPQDQKQCGEQMQEKLDPPTSLTANISVNPELGIVIEWKPPFTLSEISHYTIEFVRPESSRPSAKFQTNKTSFVILFSDLNITSRCNNSYRFTLIVSGVNFAGVGGSSNITVTISQDHRDCMQDSMTVTAQTERDNISEMTVTFTQSEHPSEYLLYYIGIACTSATLTVLMLAVTIVCITFFGFKRRQKTKQTKTEISNFELDSNSCYVVANITKNEAYEQLPHIYDVIAPATVCASTNNTDS